MTDPSPMPTRTSGTPAPDARRQRRRRRMSALAAAALTGAALAPGVGTLPASAADPECGSATFSATASADLFRLDLLDLHPLGVDLGPVAKVNLATTDASTGATSTADARYLIANLAGIQIPAGPLDANAHQESPPAAPAGVTVNPAQFDIGALAAGTGSLTARTTWPAAGHCPPPAGPTAEAKAAAVDATVLPAVGGGALVRLPGNASSSTVTGFVQGDSRLNPTATAAASATEIHLLQGTPGEITAKVVSEPALTVTAAGDKAKSTVKYTAPVLDITLPDGHTERLDSVHKQIDIPVPAAGGPESTALKAARAAVGPLTSLMRKLPKRGPITSTSGLTTPDGATSVGGAVDNPDGTAGALDLPALDAVTGALDALDGSVEESTPADPVAEPDAVIRLSVGALTQQVTDDSVKASAASLRVQVIAKKAGDDGYGKPCTCGESTVMDLGVGVLDTTATLPPSTSGGGTGGTSGGGSTGGEGGTGGENGGTGGVGGGTGQVSGVTGGGSLPVTGPGVALLVGGATALVLGGRLLMVLARRRFLS